MLNGWLKNTMDMETKFNFKSQIATDKNQSERLLALGLKPETADCHWAYHSVTATRYVVAHPCDGVGECIPAWSLHRLLCLIPKEIELSFGKWVCSNINYDYNIIYLNDNQDDFVGFYEGSIYNKAIDCIEWLIKEGYFNKEYLV